eukprot:4532026-Heterocapsa_arctica.AAC.1
MTDIIEDLQRQVASYEDLYDNAPPKGHPIPVISKGTGPAGSTLKEEVASGSGGHMADLVAQA